MAGTNTEVRAYLAKYLKSIRNNDALKALEGFDKFIAAMEKLNRISDNYYQMNEMGQMTYLTQESYQKLLQAYEEADRACTEFLASPVAENMTHPAREVQEMLNKDMQHLGVLSFENGKVISLPMALDRARGYSVTVEDPSDISTVGGALSSRMKVSVVNSRGKTINGYFTEHNDLNYRRDYKKALLDMAAVLRVRSDSAENPADKALLDRVAQKLEAFNSDTKVAELFKNKIIPDSVRTMDGFPMKKIDQAPPYCDLGNKIGESPWMWWYFGVSISDAKKLTEMASQFSFEDFDNKLKKGLQAFYKSMDGVTTQRGIYSKELHIKDGSNVSRRNCALSTLANMLGTPDIVAASVPMEVKVGDTTKSGVFMENAKGINFTKTPYESPIGQRSLDDFVTDGAKKKLAALQVLDFLGSNIDRHCYNISYVFDEEGHLVDLQGYDNDSSFTPNDFPADKKQHVLAALDDITVIPRNVADALRTMTPEMLKHTLRSNLTSDEIAAACRRLEQMRSRLKEGAERQFDENGKLKLVPGTISVIEDHEWASLKTTDLAALSEDEQKELELPEDPANIKRETPAWKKGNGYYSKNIFGVALLLPATKRTYDARMEDKEMLKGKPKNLSEVQKKAVLSDDKLRAKVRNYLLEKAAELTEDTVVLDDSDDFAEAEEIRIISNISPEDNRAFVQTELARLMTTNYVGGQKQYQNLKTALQAFASADSEAISTRNVADYYKKVQNLYQCADAYLLYKQNPGNRRERCRVEVAEHIKSFARQQMDSMEPYTEAEHQREIYSTLDMVTGMARMIDTVDRRIQLHTNANADEAYLSEYHKMAMEGLNTLVELSQKKDLTEDEETLAIRSIAKLVTGELVENDFQRRGGPNRSLVEHSKTPEERQKNVEVLGKDFAFARMLGNIGPSKLKVICSDPKSVQMLTQHIMKIRKNTEKAKQVQAPAKSNVAEQGQLNAPQAGKSSSFTFLPH